MDDVLLIVRANQILGEKRKYKYIESLLRHLQSKHQNLFIISFCFHSNNLLYCFYVKFSLFFICFRLSFKSVQMYWMLSLFTYCNLSCSLNSSMCDRKTIERFRSLRSTEYFCCILPDILNTQPLCAVSAMDVVVCIRIRLGAFAASMYEKTRCLRVCLAPTTLMTAAQRHRSLCVYVLTARCYDSKKNANRRLCMCVYCIYLCVTLTMWIFVF